MFDYRKILIKKNIKKNGFPIFGFTTQNKNENQILLKLVKKLYIFKLFNIYTMEKNKLNEFEKVYKINLLTLNLIFIFLHFFFSFIFPLYFRSFVFSLKFSENQT